MQGIVLLMKSPRLEGKNISPVSFVLRRNRRILKHPSDLQNDGKASLYQRLIQLRKKVFSSGSCCTMKCVLHTSWHRDSVQHRLVQPSAPSQHTDMKPLMSIDPAKLLMKTRNSLQKRSLSTGFICSTVITAVTQFSFSMLLSKL
jgi:hypothetical protein